MNETTIHASYSYQTIPFLYKTSNGLGRKRNCTLLLPCLRIVAEIWFFLCGRQLIVHIGRQLCNFGQFSVIILLCIRNFNNCVTVVQYVMNEFGMGNNNLYFRFLRLDFSKLRPSTLTSYFLD